MVKYVDYETDWIDPGNIFSPFVYKRKSFEHEREVRAVVTKWPTGPNGIDLQRETIATGIKIQVDLERLIENIYVAPTAPNWLTELAEQLTKRFGFSFKVAQSKLADEPLF
jgi:hypothetical protein